MQFTPFDTHYNPVIAVKHKELVVGIISVQSFNLQVHKVIFQKQSPSFPPPKQAVCSVYSEQIDLGMQFTPFDTHYNPVIAVKHKELVVGIISVQSFNLQVHKVIFQKQSPSIP